MDKTRELQKIIDTSKKIVFFGGAGVSTESGIPDFRSKDGLYNQKYKYNPEKILSHSFFLHNTLEFYEFYFDKMVVDNVLPNDCHKALAKLEKMGKLSAVITQNIDDLHEMAGSKKIIHLHGQIKDNYCMKCHKYYSLNEITNEKIPMCTCGGIIKPDVVLYEEALNEKAVYDAIKEISTCDTLIIGGTSLKVYPACNYIRYFKGDNLVVINREKLENVYATLEINESISEVFKKLDLK